MQNGTERNAQCLAAGDWWFYCWLWPHRRRYSDLVYSIAGIPNILVGKLIEHHQHGSISHLSILYSQLCRHIVTMRSCNWLCRSMRLSIRWIMRIYVHRSIVARIMCSCSGSRYIIFLPYKCLYTFSTSSCDRINLANGCHFLPNDYSLPHPYCCAERICSNWVDLSFFSSSKKIHISNYFTTLQNKLSTLL